MEAYGVDDDHPLGPLDNFVTPVAVSKMKEVDDYQSRWITLARLELDATETIGRGPGL